MLKRHENASSEKAKKFEKPPFNKKESPVGFASAKFLRFAAFPENCKVGENIGHKMAKKPNKS